MQKEETTLKSGGECVKINDITRANMDRVGRGVKDICDHSPDGGLTIARTFSTSIQFFNLGYKACEDDMRKKVST